MSAVNGEGIDDLLKAMDDVLAAAQHTLSISLPPEESALIAWLYRHADVYHREADEDGMTTLSVNIDEENLNRLRGKMPSTCVFHISGTPREGKAATG